MVRTFLLFTVAGLLLLPDWSDAGPLLNRLRARRAAQQQPVACAPVFSYPAPVVSYQPPVAYSPPVVVEPVYVSPVVHCPPAVAAPSGPRVVPERMPEANPKGKPMTETNNAVPVPVSPITRVGASEEHPVRVPPTAVPERPQFKPLPELASPKPVGEEPVVKPAAKVEKPDMGLPAFPTLGGDAKPELPKPEPLPKFDANPKAEPLPGFDVPPLPALPVPEGKTIAKSSPVNADPTADVYPVVGLAPADATAKRAVGFVNKSGRDLLLTVNGKSTMLPSGQFLKVDLPAKFVWQLGGDKERETTVPASAPGVDVVIRK